jgi:hypothetical protein
LTLPNRFFANFGRATSARNSICSKCTSLDMLLKRPVSLARIILRCAATIFN